MGPTLPDRDSRTGDQSANGSMGLSPRFAAWALALISAGAISYELLLMRVLAVVHGHHFAAMVISLALLGIGAGGSLTLVFRGWLAARQQAVLPMLAVLLGLTAFLGTAWSLLLEVDPRSFIWDLGGLWATGALYLSLSLPLVFTGSATSLILHALPDRIGQLYRADLLGAGLGAVAVTLAMFYLPPEFGLKVVLLLGLLAGVLLVLGSGGGTSRMWGLLLFVAGAVVFAFVPDDVARPWPSRHRPMSRILEIPDAEIAIRRPGPMGMVSVVSSPTTPFRYAPGLPLDAPVRLPDQLRLFKDGAPAGVLNRDTGNRADWDFYEFLPTALPYHLLYQPRTLVLDPLGGFAVQEALWHRAGVVDVAEPDPVLAKIVAHDLARYSGRVYTRPGVSVHPLQPRAMLAAGREAYDLIRFSADGGAAGWMQAVSEDFLLTRQGIEDMLQRLAPGGMLAATLPLELPPRRPLRLLATIAEGLRELDAEPADCVLLARSSTMVLVLAKRDPFVAFDLETARTFCADRGLELAWYPGMDPAEANSRIRLPEPWYHRGARDLLGAGSAEDAEEAGMSGRYPFDIEPVGDDRPYFDATFELTELPGFWSRRSVGGAALVPWGYVYLWTALAQVAVLAGLLILLPLAAASSGARAMPARLRHAAYFALLGLGFMFLEITVMKRLSRFLGHPVLSAALVIAVFLVFAGLGAQAAGRINARPAAPGTDPSRRTLRLAVLGVAGGTALLFALAPLLEGFLMGAPLALKALAAGLAMAPLAFCLGLPLPLGLHLAQKLDKGWIPWGWGINGCASVLGALAASVLAIHLGFLQVAAAACILYIAADLVLGVKLTTGEP